MESWNSSPSTAIGIVPMITSHAMRESGSSRHVLGLRNDRNHATKICPIFLRK
jgi:hypothetical protein